MFSFSSCSQSEFINADVFVTRFNTARGQASLLLTDFSSVEENSGGSVKECEVIQGQSRALIRLFCDEQKRVYECRVIILKGGNDLKKETLTKENKEFFILLCGDVYSSFSGKSKTAAEEKTELLFPNSDFPSAAEKNETDGKILLTVLQNDVCIDFSVVNGWLKQIESTVKPESKIGFGEQTQIRQETVPLR